MRHVEQYNEQSISKSTELHENYKKLDRRYQESNLLRELSLRLISSKNPQDVIKSCLQELERRFGYSRGMVMLLTADERKLYTAEVLGFPEEARSLYNLCFDYPNTTLNDQVFAKILESGKTVAINDISKFSETLKKKNRELMHSLNVKSLIIASIQDADRKYGLLIVGAVGEDRPLSDDDRHLIENITRLLSISFQNARMFQEERSLRTALEKYVPAASRTGINTIYHAVGKLEPKKAVVTALFIDLRDFTTISETMAPQRTIEMLNIYMEYVCQRIVEYGGVIDKLVADAVVAYFPSADGDPSEGSKAALLASIRILAELEIMDYKLAQKGFNPLSVGIGLNTGTVILGLIGCELKIDYTAIGDAMNLASRLESMSKDYRIRSESAKRGVLIVSDSTFSFANIDIDSELIRDQAIRGRKQKEIIHFIDLKMAISWLNLKKLKDDKFNLNLSSLV